MKTVYLVYPEKLGRIAPELYGHFAEHIGGVMRDGLWVGKDSPIPNIRGFRREIVEKLRRIAPPLSVGRAGASPKPTVGATVSAGIARSARAGGHPMTAGLRQTRWERTNSWISAAWWAQSRILP